MLLFRELLKPLIYIAFWHIFTKNSFFLNVDMVKYFRSILRYVPFLMKQSCVDLVIPKFSETPIYIYNKHTIVGRKHELSEGMIEQHRKEQFNGT